MSKLDDNFDDYQYGKGNNTMVIHNSSMARDASTSSALDMPRKFNEYKQSRQQRGEDVRHSVQSSNRGEKRMDAH